SEATGARNHPKRGKFHPKQHLEHLTEKLKLLGLAGGGGEEKEQLCSWHKGVAALEDGCSSPGAAGGPAAAPLQDREQILRDLEKLKRQKGELEELRSSGERRCQEYLAQTEAERQRVVSEFRRLRRFLKEQELVLLAELGEWDREMLRKMQEQEAKLTGEMSLLQVLICQVEKELEGAARGFLQVGAQPKGEWERNSSRRPAETFWDLEQWLRVISRRNKVLGETLRRFQAFITLDPDTAGSNLVLSRDRRGVRWGDVGGQDPHPNPTVSHRFPLPCCILGSRGFTRGSCHWDVEVAEGQRWALGVALGGLHKGGEGSVLTEGSVPGGVGFQLRPEEGIWAVGRCRSRCCAFTSPITPLPILGSCSRLRVVLDRDGGGRVAFYLAGDPQPIFTFQKASFGNGERVFPFFWV
ncbi:TRI27 protein, partial [Urocolius indicus]|nr:TRI27 protein [Urocolius indicus]